MSIGMSTFPVDPPKRPRAFVKFDEAMLRIADISHWRWERGHSYTSLKLVMRDGSVFEHRDHMGSAYDLEAELKLAVGAA